MADDVQPQDGGQGAAPYQEYLDRLPEEVRGDVEPIFKEWDSNTTRRFQEASEYRKQWEPFEQVGVHNHDPQAVEWALQFYNNLNNPQAIQGWYEQYANQNGLAGNQQLPQDIPSDDLYVDPTVQQMKEMLTPLQQQMEQLNGWREQQEQTQRLREAQQLIDRQMAEIEQQHPSEFNREAIEKFIANYVESDPQHAVQRAFQDYQAFVAQIQREYAQSKASQPDPPLTGGVANGQADPIKWADTARIALEQLQAQRNT